MNPEHDRPPRKFRHQLRRYGGTAFTSTKTHTATCEGTPFATGGPVAITRTATSHISQADADAKALHLARTEAETELYCLYSSLKCVVTGHTATPEACAARTSTVSQAEADALALAAAQEIADSL